MRDFPRQKLKELVALYGPALYNDVTLCRNVLMSSCSGYQLEVDALVTALEEGVVSELFQASNSVPYLEMLSRMARRMQEKRGIPDDAARWAVNSWALALGLIQVAIGEDTASNSPTARASYNAGGGTVSALPNQTTDGSPSSGHAYSAPLMNSSSQPPPPPPFVQSAPFAPASASSRPPERPRATNRTLLIVGIVAVLVIASAAGIFALASSGAGGLFGKATPTPSPTPVRFPTLSSAYGGKARNTTGKLNSEFSLTAITQNQGNVSGNLNVGLPLVGSGPFQGTVSQKGAVHFVDKSNDGSNITITFTGTIVADGAMSGTYSVSNNQGGSWNATPTTAPVVYPLLFPHYTGTFSNNANGKSGVLALDLKVQDEQTISGNFLINGASYPMTGTVGSDNSIQFSIAPDKTSSIKFSGTVNTDGTMNGSYTATTGGNGSWRVIPL